MKRKQKIIELLTFPDLISRVSIAGEVSKEEDKESESSDEDERDSNSTTDSESESSDGSSEDQEIEIDFQVAMWDVGNLHVPMHTKPKTIKLHLICPW